MAQLNVRISDALKREIKIQAASNGQSVESLVTELLSQAFQWAEEDDEGEKENDATTE